MNVYVAGKDIADVNAIQSAIRWAGHSINLDWTRDFQGTPRSRELAEEERDAAVEADVLVLVYCNGMLGAWIEVGMALGNGVPVIVFGSHRDSVFWRLPIVSEVSTVTELTDRLRAVEDANETRREQRR